MKHARAISAGPPGARTKAQRVLRWGLMGLLLAAAAGWRFASSLDGALHPHAPSRLILDRHGRFLGEVEAKDGQLGYWPLPEVLPERIRIATLETEDREFFSHPGVNLKSVVRAIGQNVRNRRIISGASTVPMQVARLQHPKSRSLLAKLREAAEALLLVKRHGHDQVLRQYLQIAPYGNRAHGVARAARLYFDKPVEDCSWRQAAFLAALPQQPGRMSPWTSDGLRRASARAQRILIQLHARGHLTDDELRLALASDLGLVPKPHRHKDATHAVLEWARRLPDDGGFLYTSTLDLDVQRIAARAVRENVARLHWANATNSAALVTDVQTGEVLAWVGSADYFDSEAHGAIDFLSARRSPGSTLKPFLYGLALERKDFTAATELPDVATEFADLEGRAWAPENASHTFLGPMLLREALGNSRNIPALKVLSQLGVDRALDLFKKGGVQELSHEPGHYGLSLATGAVPVTPAELAVLYSAFGNDGVTRPLRHFVGLEPKQKPQTLFRPDTAQMVRHLLADPQARRPSFPAGGNLDYDDFAVAIKTGTSQGYRDAWTVALTDRLLTVVWVGNHDWKRMNALSGATAAGPAVHQLLDRAQWLRLPHLPQTAAFTPPSSWAPQQVCALSGRLAGKGCTSLKTEHFAPGTEPHELCPFHREVALDVRNQLRAGPQCPPNFTIKRALLDLPPVYAQWARQQHLEVAPTADSPLCPSGAPPAPKISITEPRTKARYLFDPDTPREFSTVRLSANVTPATEEIVWLVDGRPVGVVGWPHELRLPLSPGTHTIRATFRQLALESAPVTVRVDD